MILLMVIFFSFISCFCYKEIQLHLHIDLVSHALLNHLTL